MASLLRLKAPEQFTNVVSFIALIIFVPLFLVVTYQSIRFVTHASGTKAAIVVDTTATLEPVRTGQFHAFVQGKGTTDITAIKKQVQPLAPAVIRIDSVFDRYGIVTKNGTILSYHFEKLDQAVDAILSVGAKPCISLSAIPQTIAEDGNGTNPPSDWNTWKEIVSKTVDHYSGVTGKNISGMMYEIGNEPDTAAAGTWGLDGEKSYLTLYRYAVLGAEQVQRANTFSIGGPATSTLSKPWITALAASGLRVDFFSWHAYTSDPKQTVTDQKNITDWLTPYPTYRVKPTMVTAFGFSKEQDTRYRTGYAAAYTAAVFRENMTGGPTYLFTYELQDPHDTTGLISATNSAMVTPRYQLFPFIDSMVGTRIKLSGEGSWVTGLASSKDGVIRTILINFDPSGNHIEQVPVTFTHLSASSYTLTQRSLMGQTTKLDVSATNGTVTRSIYMPSQSVVILELRKK